MDWLCRCRRLVEPHDRSLLHLRQKIAPRRLSCDARQRAVYHGVERMKRRGQEEGYSAEKKKKESGQNRVTEADWKYFDAAVVGDSPVGSRMSPWLAVRTV